MVCESEPTGPSPSTPCTPHAVPLSLRQQLALIKQIHRTNARGETRLHLAARRGDAAQCEELLHLGAVIDARDYAGWTPLHEACNKGRLEAAEVLLRHGADVNARATEEETTPLHDAVLSANVELVKLLLRSGADREALNKENQKPIDVCLPGSALFVLLQSNSETADNVSMPLKEVEVENLENVNPAKTPAFDATPRSARTARRLGKRRSDRALFEEFERKTQEHQLVSEALPILKEETVLIENAINEEPSETSKLEVETTPKRSKSVSSEIETRITRSKVKQGGIKLEFGDEAEEGEEEKFVPGPSHRFYHMAPLEASVKMQEMVRQRWRNRLRDRAPLVASTCQVADSRDDDERLTDCWQIPETLSSGLQNILHKQRKERQALVQEYRRTRKKLRDFVVEERVRMENRRNDGKRAGVGYNDLTAIRIIHEESVCNPENFDVVGLRPVIEPKELETKLSKLLKETSKTFDAKAIDLYEKQVSEYVSFVNRTGERPDRRLLPVPVPRIVLRRLEF